MRVTRPKRVEHWSTYDHVTKIVVSVWRQSTIFSEDETYFAYTVKIERFRKSFRKWWPDDTSDFDEDDLSFLIESLQLAQKWILNQPKVKHTEERSEAK